MKQYGSRDPMVISLDFVKHISLNIARVCKIYGQGIEGEAVVWLPRTLGNEGNGPFRLDRRVINAVTRGKYTLYRQG